MATLGCHLGPTWRCTPTPAGLVRQGFGSDKALAMFECTGSAPLNLSALSVQVLNGCEWSLAGSGSWFLDCLALRSHQSSWGHHCREEGSVRVPSGWQGQRAGPRWLQRISCTGRDMQELSGGLGDNISVLFLRLVSNRSS